MWRTRPVLLLAILALAGIVGASYALRVRRLAARTGTPPKPLPAGTSSTAQDWVWKQVTNGCARVEVRAKDFRQVKEPDKFELAGVQLRLAVKNCAAYDLVQSAHADFDVASGELYSEGAVDITMDLPAGAPPSGRLVRIHSSGVHFDTRTGSARTDRPTSFEFDRSRGTARGAEYDPRTRELHLLSAVDLLWRAAKPDSPPMRVEAGELRYRESESKVYFSPWSKLTRGALTLEAASSVATLDEGVIREVDAEQARGADRQPERTLDYAAARLIMNFDATGKVDKIRGEPDASLVSTSSTGRTAVNSDRIDMSFDGTGANSILRTAVAVGHAVVRSEPAASAGAAAADTRILRSNAIDLKMRDGGREIDSVETTDAGTIEFLPNRPDKPHRMLTGERLWIRYGAGNRIESFRAANASTRTENPKPPGAKRAPPPALTSSKDLTAAFDPKTGQLARLEQWNDFRYQAGDRQARADRAVLDQAANVITLTKGARVWDPTGSVSAARIVLDQGTGDFEAEGSVNSTRMPDHNGDSSGMLASGEPLHARADQMTSADNNRHIRYEGHAVAWQGANRLRADSIDIDRENGALNAHGNVVSEFPDTKKRSPSQAPAFTVVYAGDLVYTDDDRLACYTGDPLLVRPDLRVKGRRIEAYLKDTPAPKDAKAPAASPPKDGASLDHAFADGNVEIVSASPGRTRTGTSDHAEYYVDNAKVILNKGRPLLVDSLKGNTSGQQLTWFSNNDRLLVEGAKSRPSQSVLYRK